MNAFAFVQTRICKFGSFSFEQSSKDIKSSKKGCVYVLVVRQVILVICSLVLIDRRKEKRVERTAKPNTKAAGSAEKQGKFS